MPFKECGRQNSRRIRPFRLLRLSKLWKSYKNAAISEAFPCPTLPLEKPPEQVLERPCITNLGPRQPAQGCRPLDPSVDGTALFPSRERHQQRTLCSFVQITVAKRAWFVATEAYKRFGPGGEVPQVLEARSMLPNVRKTRERQAESTRFCCLRRLAAAKQAA